MNDDEIDWDQVAQMRGFMIDNHIMELRVGGFYMKLHEDAWSTDGEMEVIPDDDEADPREGMSLSERVRFDALNKKSGN